MVIRELITEVRKFNKGVREVNKDVREVIKVRLVNKEVNT